YFIAPDKPHPWAIWVADASTRAAKEIWHGSATPQGSFPFMAEDTGGGVLNLGAGNQNVMASEGDGWADLYSLSAEGGAPKLTTRRTTAKSGSGLWPRKKKLFSQIPPGARWPAAISGPFRLQVAALRSSPLGRELNGAPWRSTMAEP